MHDTCRWGCKALQVIAPPACFQVLSSSRAAAGTSYQREKLEGMLTMAYDDCVSAEMARGSSRLTARLRLWDGRYCGQRQHVRRTTLMVQQHVSSFLLTRNWCSCQTYRKRMGRVQPNGREQKLQLPFEVLVQPAFETDS